MANQDDIVNSMLIHLSKKVKQFEKCRRNCFRRKICIVFMERKNEPEITLDFEWIASAHLRLQTNYFQGTTKR
ncbi:MAG: hypothetical protein M3Y53_00285 [Thermoproteota archaeon]|nr:hypothetical protein [Thermoproteota archaeon]